MDASQALSLFFICFPLSLLISFPPEPPSLFSKLADSINQKKTSRSSNVMCARTHAAASTYEDTVSPQKDLSVLNNNNNNNNSNFF